VPVAIIIATLLLAQAPVPTPESRPVLQNTGKPMRLNYTCTDDEILAAGLSCTSEEPCPVYLELSAVEPLGAKVFAAGNLHTPTTTLASVLVASDDGGNTWHEPHDRIRSAVVDHIQFLDLENGWASGQVLQTLPRDPFLLITTDGGRTWRRRTVFSESRVGAIEAFWFEDKSHGWMLIDRSRSGEQGSRYELYESMTGGENWMIREAGDRPLKLKRPVAARNSDWRLRTDAATKSYRIERRQGEKWTPVASFLVVAGSCKPSDRPVEEPKPPPEVEQPAAPPPPRTAPKTPPTLKKKTR
jgi:hypothetical protein